MTRAGSRTKLSPEGKRGSAHRNGGVHRTLRPGAASPSRSNTARRALYALDSDTGAVLKRIPFENRRSLNGPAVSRGRVYAGFGGTFGFGPSTPVPEGGVVCLGLPGDDGTGD